jgi:hypothetical protein
MNCNNVNQPLVPSPIVNQVATSQTIITWTPPLVPPKPTYGTFWYVTQSN